MKSLMKTDWDLVEKMIDEMLSDRIRAYEYYNYFIINDDTVLVKVYDEDDEVMFTVKAKLAGERLEVIDVW
ncbi:hypothetical protein [Stygiolobus sp. RP850M]|uniref:hypothetical protein n=1 Tax=Stygiolobus sp. RP850M TaxID=3133137 RepID=UPI00307D71ED